MQSDPNPNLKIRKQPQSAGSLSPLRPNSSRTKITRTQEGVKNGRNPQQGSTRPWHTWIQLRGPYTHCYYIYIIHNTPERSISRAQSISRRSSRPATQSLASRRKKKPTAVVYMCTCARARVCERYGKHTTRLDPAGAGALASYGSRVWIEIKSPRLPPPRLTFKPRAPSERSYDVDAAAAELAVCCCGVPMRGWKSIIAGLECEDLLAPSRAVACVFFALDLMMEWGFEGAVREVWLRG